jgi:hypothetical protein
MDEPFEKMIGIKDCLDEPFKFPIAPVFLEAMVGYLISDGPLFLTWYEGNVLHKRRLPPGVQVRGDTILKLSEVLHVSEEERLRLLDECDKVEKDKHQ